MATSRNEVNNLTSHQLATARTTTHYWQAGPSDGPLMIFVHGWPEIGVVWRAQMEAMAARGWRCVAPDLRGCGGSSAPDETEIYVLKEVVDDLVELHTHLGGVPAIWIGHDWGSPIVGLIAAHHANICRALVLVSVPYLPNGWALPNLLPLVDRSFYPAEKYPDGQWDYWRFYLNNFDRARKDMEADIRATLASLYVKGDPASVGRLSPSAEVSKNGGRYGSEHRAPAIAPDASMWPREDFETLVAAYEKTGFAPINSFYMNDEANIAYATSAPNAGRLNKPVLFINDEYEPFSNINASAVGDPMRASCENLTIVNLPAGHWVTLELKVELTAAILEGASRLSSTRRTMSE